MIDDEFINNMSPKKGVRYIEDIILETAEELNISDKDVREIWKIHKTELRELIEDPEPRVIKIPYIGDMFFNAHTFWKYAQKYKVYRRDVKNMSKFEKVINEINKISNEWVEKNTLNWPYFPQLRIGNLHRNLRLYRKSLGLFDEIWIYPSKDKLYNFIEKHSTKFFKGLLTRKDQINFKTSQENKIQRRNKDIQGRKFHIEYLKSKGELIDYDKLKNNELE